MEHVGVRSLTCLLAVLAGCGIPQSPRPMPVDAVTEPVADATTVDASPADAPGELPDCPTGTALRLQAAVTVERGRFPAATLQVRIVGRPAAACRLPVGPSRVTLSCDGGGGPFATSLSPVIDGTVDGPGNAATPDDPVLFAPGDVFRLESAAELPTQATVGWESDDAPRSWSATVPVSLMVENGSTPLESTGAVTPFELPQARGSSAGLVVALGPSSAGLGMMGPMLRVAAVVTNGSDRTIQVDRMQFHALVPGIEMRGVDNSTPRPMTAWVSGMFFCLRDLPAALPFPDHTRLAPGQQAWGWLCWTADDGADVGRWDRDPPAATVAYGDPPQFTAPVAPSPAFMGVFLPP